LPGKIKDYIAIPKPNGYQSLHTTVFCEEGKIVEFQIRTFKMHQRAEYGIAAHWHYTEQGKQSTLMDKKLLWVKELANWQNRFQNQKDFLENLKIDIFNNRIFVFTPKGDVIDLPEGATPVDFAYQIHSEIGNHCYGAKVNEKMVALDFALKNGDIVEIITQKNAKPKLDWLKFVRTAKAKERIKSFCHKQKTII
jgi:GTP pyrophosphokinase